jgi:hypothetical protein
MEKILLGRVGVIEITQSDEVLTKYKKFLLSCKNIFILHNKKPGKNTEKEDV